MHKIIRLISDNKYYIGISSLILVLIFYKLQFLNLPYYWDEAWSYIPAIFSLFRHKLSILPGAIPAELSRGHPLLFYFLVVCWMKIFGAGIISTRIFALLISILLLIEVFQFCKEHFSQETGIIAVLFILVQSVFLAQSCFLLPEILLALLSLLTINSYLKKQYLIFVLWAALLLLTKETGVVLIITLFIHQIIFFKNIRIYLREAIILSIPLIIIFLYYLRQKVVFGWFFFPEHLSYINQDIKEVFSRLVFLSDFLFVQMGRIMITFFALFGLIIGLIFHKWVKNFNFVYSLLLLFILFFLVFSSVNFFTTRYLLTLVPIFIILSGQFISEYIKNHFLKISIIVSCAVFCLYNTTKYQNTGDVSIGFINSVKVHQKVASFCENKHFYDKHIATHFIMSIDLTNPDAGYLKDKRLFFKNVGGFDSNTELLIVSQTELSDEFNEFREKYHDKMIARFESNDAWSEIYSIK